MYDQPYTPAYIISRGGIDITANFQDRLTSLRLDLSAGGGSGDILTIELDDRDWKISRPLVGETLAIALGYLETGLARMGTFEVDEVVYNWVPKSISIRASSIGMMTALKSPVVKNYTNQTLGDIVRDLAKAGNLDAVVSPRLDGIRIPQLNSGTSAMHLLGELERRFDGVAKIGDGRLSFTPKDTGETASGAETSIVTLRPEHITELHIRDMSRTAYSKTRAAFFNSDTNMRTFVETPSPLKLNGELPPFTIGRVFPTKGEAEAATRSQMAALTRGEVDGSITLFRGDPYVRDQSRVVITGSRDGIDGSYVVDTATHVYTKGGGYVTALTIRGVGTGSTFQAADENDELPLPGEVTGGLKIGPGGRPAGPV